jgi:hypothetical protein
MTEAEILDRFFDTIQNVLTIFSIFFTLISGYLAALYLFLRQAPFVLRCIAFSLLTIGLVFLGGVAVTIQRLQEGLFASWSRLTQPSLSFHELVNPLPFDVASAIGMSQQHLGIALGWGVATLVYLALAYLTFLYRWPDAKS